MNEQKRSGEHQRRVNELRRSNAAGTHGSNKYTRTVKYPIDYLELLDEETAECESGDLV